MNLEKALAAFAKLPEADQEAIGQTILDEIESERHWRTRFANSQNKMADLSRRAVKHIARGTDADVQ
jgi:hypothetical protein